MKLPLSKYVASREYVLGGRTRISVTDPIVAFEQLAAALGGRARARAFIRDLVAAGEGHAA